MTGEESPMYRSEQTVSADDQSLPSFNQHCQDVPCFDDKTQNVSVWSTTSSIATSAGVRVGSDEDTVDKDPQVSQRREVLHQEIDEKLVHKHQLKYHVSGDTMQPNKLLIGYPHYRSLGDIILHTTGAESAIYKSEQTVSADNQSLPSFNQHCQDVPCFDDHNQHVSVCSTTSFSVASSAGVRLGSDEDTADKDPQEPQKHEVLQHQEIEEKLWHKYQLKYQVSGDNIQPIKHNRITGETTLEKPLSIEETVLEQLLSTEETPLKRPQISMETPLKHPQLTEETPLKQLMLTERNTPSDETCCELVVPWVVHQMINLIPQQMVANSWTLLYLGTLLVAVAKISMGHNQQSPWIQTILSLLIHLQSILLEFA